MCTSRSAKFDEYEASPVYVAVTVVAVVYTHVCELSKDFVLQSPPLLALSTPISFAFQPAHTHSLVPLSILVRRDPRSRIDDSDTEKRDGGTRRCS